MSEQPAGRTGQRAGLEARGDQPLPIVPEDDSTDIGVGRGLEQNDRVEANGATSSSGGRSTRRVAFAMAAAAAAIAFVGAVLINNGDATDATAEAQAAGTGGVVEAQADNSTVDLAEGAQVASATAKGDSLAGADRSEATMASFPPSDEHRAIDDVTALFEQVNQVDAERSWAVAYVTATGPLVVSASGAHRSDLRVAVGFEQAARLPIMSSGDASWAVDPTNLDQVWLVSSQFYVMDLDREGRVGFINDSLEPINIGESSFGAWGPGFDVPPGADLLPVPGRALFVLPATGGTFEYERNGVVAFSDDRLMAASTQGEVFQRCDQLLACELYVTARGVDGEFVISGSGPPGVDLDAKIWQSPGGDMLVVVDSQGSRIINLAGQLIRIDAQVTAADWAEDGSMVAMLAGDHLVLVAPDFGRGAVGPDQVATLPIAASAPAVMLLGFET